MSWGRIYLCTDTWNFDQSFQGYTQKLILLRFWEKFHCQFCYSPTTLLPYYPFLRKTTKWAKKKIDIEEKGKKKEREQERRIKKRFAKKCLCACAKNNSRLLSHFLPLPCSWRKPGHLKKRLARKLRFCRY